MRLICNSVLISLIPGGGGGGTPKHYLYGYVPNGLSISVLGRILERGIKNWLISRTGYQYKGNFFLERGANLESWAVHTHPKTTQVPPPPPGLIHTSVGDVLVKDKMISPVSNT